MQQQQYVGIDLHRRRSVIVRMDDAGEVLGVTKVDNDPVQMAVAIAEAGRPRWPWRQMPHTGSSVGGLEKKRSS